MRYSNEQKGRKGRGQWGRRTLAECVVEAKWTKCINEQEDQPCQTFLIWKFKIPISKETLSVFVFTESSHGTDMPAARWRHLSLSACGAISSHFLTWQHSFKWHFQHHLVDQEIQSGWRRQRWAWSNPSWQILIQEIRKNGRPWA